MPRPSSHTVFAHLEITKNRRHCRLHRTPHAVYCASRKWLCPERHPSQPPMQPAVCLSAPGTTSVPLRMGTYKYVCIGGGNAAGYLAREMVSRGLSPGQLCIIGDEQVVSYERPALSKAFLFPQGAARLPGFHTCVGGGGERQEPGWYSDKGITFKAGCKVVSADLAAKCLTLDTGDTLSYEHLVIATGARATTLSDFRTPGADLGGVHTLRNVADGTALLAALEAAKVARPGGAVRVVIVGGGYIGMEVAAGLALHPGVAVSVVFPEQHLLARLLTPQLAGFYEAYYAAKGVTLVSGARGKELVGEGGQVAGVLLDNGTTLPADLVVVGVGARPNSELFKGQLALDKGGGISVDGSLAASVPGVYAIGDVASFPLAREGGALGRQEHVTHARQSAAHVGATLMGAPPPSYDYLPYFYSREFSLAWHFWGSSAPSDTVVHWGDASPAAAMAAASGGTPAKFGAYWVRGGVVVGVFVEGATPEEMAAAKAVASSRPAAPGEGVLAQQGIGWACACKL